jgi:hypothetical protein
VRARDVAVTRVYEVCLLGIITYVAASSPGKAKMKVIRSATEAGYWRIGESLSGLRCKRVSNVPTDATILEAR